MDAARAAPVRTPAHQPAAPVGRLSEHYAAARAALGHLGEHPQDTSAAVRLCRAYVALGLIEPARQLVGAADGPLGRAPAFREFAAQIARLPSGRVSWRSLQGQFERNAAQLHAKCPNLRELDATFRSIPQNFILYRTRDGNWQVCARGANGLSWMPDLFDVNGFVSQAQLPHDPRSGFCGAYAVLDDRHAALFDRVYQATQKMFLTFSPRIYVLEPDPIALGLALYTYGDGERLCHERVTVLVGPDCLAALAQELDADPRRPLPAHLVSLPPRRPEREAALQDNLRAVVAGRQQHAAEARAAARTQYDQVPSEHWRCRFANADKQPLRILGLTSRFTTVLQYAMRDLKAAFERHGHQFRLLMEQSDHEFLSLSAIAAEIAAFRPDLVFAIDHHRREYDGIIPANVPFVCWVQDQLSNLTCRAAGESLGPLDFYIAPERDQYVRHYGYPPAQGLVWTLATNEHEYSAEPLSEAELAPYRCDFSYVSNHSQLPADFHREQLAAAGDEPAARRFREYLFATLPRELARDPRTACQRAAAHVYADARREIGLAPGRPEVADALALTYLHPLANLLIRQDTLEWVADHCDRTGRTLHVYGNGWEQHPRFGRYARGMAQNGRELRAVYQASRINLQIMPFGAVHPRLLDGLAAGGFFLLRYSPFDVIHEPVKRLLAAVDQYGVEADVPVPARRMPELVQALRELRALYGEPPPGLDVEVRAGELARFREMAAAGYRRVGGALFERYADVSFASPAELAARADRFLSDADGRARAAAQMRTVVVANFSYTALIRDLLNFLSDTFSQQCGASRADPAAVGPLSSG